MTSHALSVALPRPRAGAVLNAYRAERRKLLAQLSTRILALVCVLGPLSFAVILNGQSGLPSDSLLGVWVHSSGYAVSFVVLGFAGSVGFSVVSSVLAGDLFSSEDRYGTWKTVLTRSRTRAHVFAGKVLAAATFSLALVALIAVSSLLSGLLVTGDQSLVGLGGNVLGSGESLWLVLASWLLSVPPVLAFTSLAVLFSVATRNGIAGVLGPVLAGLVMQLLASVGSGTWAHMLLLGSAFDDWHGLLSAPRFYAPMIVGSCVSLAWIVASLGAAWIILRRRDFAGPPVSRGTGWVLPARAVAASAALIVVLGAAGNLGPAAVTKARLEASIAPAFNDLTLLQQEQLGRLVPEGSKLQLLTKCSRRSGKTQGPGDDWSCTLTVVKPRPGFNPVELTPVTYEVGVKSNGCYKAQAPPSFVGQQMMSDANGHSIVNPLFTIYGCFDVTASSGKSRHSAKPSGRSSTSGGASSGTTPSGTTTTSTTTTSTTTTSPTSSSPPPSAAERRAQLHGLREAERRAGPRVMRDIEEAERKMQHESEHPQVERPPQERPPSIPK